MHGELGGPGVASSPRQVLFRLHLTRFSSRQRSSGAAPCCLGPCREYHIPCWQGCWAVVGLGNCKRSPSAQHRSDVQGGNSGLAALWPPTSLGEQPPTPSLNPCRAYVGCSTSRRSPLPHKQGFAPPPSLPIGLASPAATIYASRYRFLKICSREVCVNCPGDSSPSAVTGSCSALPVRRVCLTSPPRDGEGGTGLIAGARRCFCPEGDRARSWFLVCQAGAFIFLPH